MTEEPASEPEQTIEDSDGHPVSSKEDRSWAMICHFAGPIGALLTGGMAGFIVPLVIWIIKKEESAFVDDQGKEALNFQITVFLVMLISALGTAATCVAGIIIFLPIMIVVWLASVVLGIIAGIQANDGTRYRYPYTWRPIK